MFKSRFLLALCFIFCGARAFAAAPSPVPTPSPQTQVELRALTQQLFSALTARDESQMRALWLPKSPDADLLSGWMKGWKRTEKSRKYTLGSISGWQKWNDADATRVRFRLSKSTRAVPKIAKAWTNSQDWVVVCRRVGNGWKFQEFWPRDTDFYQDFGTQNTPHQREQFLAAEWGREPPHFEPLSKPEDRMARAALARLLDAYQHQDFAAFSRCWNPKSPGWKTAKPTFAPDLKGTRDNRFEDLRVRWGRRRVFGGETQLKFTALFTWSWLKTGETERRTVHTTWVLTLRPPDSPGDVPQFWDRVSYYGGYGGNIQDGSPTFRGRLWEEGWERTQSEFVRPPAPALQTKARARIEAMLRAFEAQNESAIRANWKSGPNAGAFANFAQSDFKEADQTHFTNLRFEHWKLFQDDDGPVLQVRMRAHWEWRDVTKNEGFHNDSLWIWALRPDSPSNDLDAAWKIDGRWTRNPITILALKNSEDPAMWARILREENEFEREVPASAPQIAQGQIPVAAFLTALQKRDVEAGLKTWNANIYLSYGDEIQKVFGQHSDSHLQIQSQRWTRVEDASRHMPERLRVRLNLRWSLLPATKNEKRKPESSADFAFKSESEVWDLWLERDGQNAWQLALWRRRNADLLRDMIQNNGWYNAWILDGERQTLSYDRMWQIYNSIFERAKTDRESARRLAFSFQSAALLIGDGAMNARALSARAGLQSQYFFDEPKSDEIALQQTSDAASQMISYGDLPGAAAMWQFMGDRAAESKDPATARVIHLQALEFARQTANGAAQIDLTNALGIDCESLQEPAQAAGYYGRAIALAKGEADRARELDSRFNLAVLKSNGGSIGPGLAAMVSCRDEAEQLKLASAKSAYGRTIGQVLNETGQTNESIAAYENALRDAQSAKDVDAQFYAVNLLLEAHSDRFLRGGASLDRERKNPDLDRAQELMVQGNALQSQTHSRWGRHLLVTHILLQTKLMLGWSRLVENSNSKQTEILIPAAQSSLDFLAPMLAGWHEESLQVQALLLQAELRRQQKRPADALQLQEQAQNLIQNGYINVRTDSLEKRGDILRDLNRLGEATTAYRGALALLEERRAGAQDKLLQSGVTQSGIAIYQKLAACLQKQNAPGDEILAAVEGGRARSLTEIMDSGGARVENEVSPAQKKRETELQRAVTQLQLRLDALSGAQNQKQIALLQSATRGAEKIGSDTAPLREELNGARLQLESFRRELFLQNPGLSAKRAAWSAPTLAQIGEKLFAGRPNRRILSYVVGDDATLLLVFSPGAKNGDAAHLDTFSLPVSRPAWIEKIREARKSLSRPSSVSDDLSELQTLLLGPAAKQLEGANELIIVPDGPLGGLPFAALNDEDGTFLLEKATISYAPGIAALMEMEKVGVSTKNEGRTEFLGLSRSFFVEIGLKPLPGTSAELQAIAPLFGTGAVIAQNEKATKEFARREMPRARFIHLATHGLLNEAAPLYSSVALSPDAKHPDGRLYARDLMEMNLNADLVVLSACETALGQEVRGEGVLGLTWALFVAGAPTSVVTQWSVDDAATSTLMPLFYAHLKEGQSPAVAMRNAQLTLLKSKTMKHPAYWAPFIVVGAGN